jgi:hypothetical protein
VIRHILLIKLRPDATDEQVDAFLREIAAVSFVGRSNVVVGRDLGLRPGNCDVAVSNDFPDVDTYKAWTEDPSHQRVRIDCLEPIAADIARCLIAV